MNPGLFIVIVLLAGAGGAIAFINQRNRVEILDPKSLIITLPNDLPTRTLPLEGTVNFRDLGGYTTTDGRHVRTGQIFRSAALHKLTDKDHALLHQLGIKLVCDLRSDEEIAIEPDRLPQDPTPEYLHLPLQFDEERDQRERVRALLFNRRKLAGMMGDFYVRVMLEENPQIYGTIFKRLADPANLPTIIHCTAGKDRTGVASALILSILGVPEETIIADYSLSNRYYDNYFRYGEQVVSRLTWLGIRAEHLQPMFLANPASLRAALQYIREAYGSVENYLHECADVSASDLIALRANLLE